MKPTVGRIVHFYRKTIDKWNAGPLAALVAYVHNDECLNLAVAHESGSISGYTSVFPKDHPNSQEFYWEWPPRPEVSTFPEPAKEGV